jgi:hypothetical protein
MNTDCRADHATMHPMNRISPRALARALLLACVGALIVAGGSAQQATAATTCKLKASEQYDRTGKNGPTYARSLRVSGGASCATGHALIHRYYRCRIASGGKKARCTRRVLGYSCTEKRSNVIPTQFDARVTCRKGRARILHDYTQLT